MPAPKNWTVILTKRPGVNGEPDVSHFDCIECPYPDNELQPNQVLIKTCYLSVDPYLRCMMNEYTGVDYAAPWIPEKPIHGSSGVGIILKSNHSHYTTGDLIMATTGWPWTKYFIQDLPAESSGESSFQKLDKTVFSSKPSLGLSFLVGLTALIGLWEKGHITEGANQTLVVSAAAGATGSLAGQMGRLLGCTRVIGICGTDEKCNWLTDTLGFDGAINYKTDNVEESLKQLCSNGIDVYFDNVGGEISEAVIKQMNQNSHVILCGQISVYNKDTPYPPPLSSETSSVIKERKIKRDRFLVLHHKNLFNKAQQQLMEWILSGKIQYKETVAEGIEKTGEAFVSMMKGGNIGKQIVHVSDAEL